mmetsp:Transcript_1173/g.2446  ORF Transcript_1173/g.2446 Transcript_1173/m.2446 type:complete len:319 (-) Transcript_1173:228-1184(-)
MVASNVGTLLGNICGAAMREILSDEQLMAWGWRVPFFSGILISFVGCHLRKHGEKGVYDAATPTSEGQPNKDPHPHNPLKMAFARGNRLALLSTSIVPMLWSAGFYVSFVWAAIFMEDLLDPPVPGAFWINSLSLLFGMTWLLPVAGAISDRVGRTMVMTISGVLTTVLGPVCLVLIAGGNSYVALCSQLMLGVLLSFFGGPLCAWLVENFSPEVRMTSASFGYDMSHAIAGGFAPALATVLYTNFGTNAAGLVYVIFGSLSVAGIYINYCFGGVRGDKESDTGDAAVNSSGTAEVEMQGSAATIDDASDSNPGKTIV